MSYYKPLIRFGAKAILFTSGLLLGVRNADIFSDVSIYVRSRISSYFSEPISDESQSSNLLDEHDISQESSPQFQALDKLVEVSYDKSKDIYK
jgi:hypothetical protein